MMGNWLREYFFGIGEAQAHVEYVIDSREVAILPSRWEFFRTALTDGNFYMVLAIIGLLAVVVWRLQRTLWWRNIQESIRGTTATYANLIPWMLRLGLGIALIGAGASGVLISPAFSPYPSLAIWQSVLGFFFLLGFLLGPTVLISVGLYLFLLTQDFYALGNLEFLGAAVALGALAARRPGLDDIFKIPFWTPWKKLAGWLPLILRLTFGGAMIFLGLYEKILNPHLSAAVVADFHLTEVIPVSVPLWVLGAGLTEIGLGLLLALGWGTRLTSVITFFVLSLSFFYFGEDVFAHVILFAVLSILFLTGGGRFSLDNFYEHRKQKT